MGAKGSKNDDEPKETSAVVGGGERGRNVSGTGSQRGRNVSGTGSLRSRGRNQSGGSGYGSVRFQQDAPERYVRRLSSTASTSLPFERTSLKRRRSSARSQHNEASSPSFTRQGSRLSQVSSGKSIGSFRTRITSVSASEYHLDLKPDLSEGLNFNLVFTCFIIVFGSSFQFGYNIGVLNQPASLIKQFFNETYSERSGEQTTETKITLLWSLTNALFIPGGMCGAFLGGWLADRLGRKKTILFSHIFAFAGAAVSSACVAAKAPELLMLGRLLVGVNSGLGNCLAPLFLSEIATLNLRGAFGTVHQLFVTIGIFLSSVFGLKQILGTPERWPFLILLETIPALTSLLILPFLHETPRFLLLVQKNRDAARKSLQFYRKREDVESHMEEMDTETQKAAPDKEEKPFQLKELFTRSLFIPLAIACMLQVVQQFSGINAVFFYSNSIFEGAGVPVEAIPYAVIGTNAVNVLMTVISVPLMDITGRRPLLLIPMVGMLLDLILITISLNLQDSISWMSYISVAAVIFYVICFAVGLGPIPMMIGSELFRQGPRPYAMAVAGVVNWLATFVIAMAFEPVQLVLKNYTFIVFLVLMLVFLVFVYFKVPETRGRTFEQIASQFQPGGSIEVEEVIEEEEEGDGDVFGDAEPNDAGEKEDTRLVTLNFGKKSPKGSESNPPDATDAV